MSAWSNIHRLLSLMYETCRDSSRLHTCRRTKLVHRLFALTHLSPFGLRKPRIVVHFIERLKRRKEKKLSIINRIYIYINMGSAYAMPVTAVSAAWRDISCVCVCVFYFQFHTHNTKLRKQTTCSVPVQIIQWGALNLNSETT